MTKWMLALTTVAALAQGCIIYETDDGYCSGCGVEFLDSGWQGDDDDDDDAAPAYQLRLTVAEGRQGDSMLTTLEAQGEFDLALVKEVVFLGSKVSVSDQIVRDDEVLLVLDIASDAEVGPVDVFVDVHDGSSAVMEDAFVVVEAQPDDHQGGGGTGGGTGGSGTGGGGTGGGMDDTGCP